MNIVDVQHVLIVGNPEPFHVGAHLLNAAHALELSAELCDSQHAYAAAWPVTKFNWHLRGHRPARLREFSRSVLERCQVLKPHALLTTGISPLADWALAEIGKLGIGRLNYLTDDPWNPAHRTTWFMQALPLYDHVFSPRRANIPDLQELGCRAVSWLPFAYAPELHYPESATDEREKELYAADVVFAGGADANRMDHLAALIREGFSVALYGGYWNRFPATRLVWRGHADPLTLRKAIGTAKVALCLVRRANRDGHSMRTFEVPAIGACMLVEDTLEHREIFGQEGNAAIYFGSLSEMIEKVRWLLGNDAERERLARAVHQLIAGGNHTYQERLASMLSHSFVK